MKIAKKPEARLVITLRLLKNTKERNAEQRNANLPQTGAGLILLYAVLILLVLLYG